MVKVSGSIYFLRERDYLTGEVSPYVKIGLVRNDKPTEKRILEHQTGNPREIFDYQTIEATFVEDLETRLHYIFGAYWVTGEWFLLDELQLQEVIDVAKAYALEQKQLAPLFDQADEFASATSTEVFLEPTPEAVDLWEELKTIKLQIAEEKAKQAIAEMQLRKLLGPHRAIPGIVSVQISKPTSSFDKVAFQDSIYFSQFASIYSKTTAEKLTGSFLLKNIPTLKKFNPILDEDLKSCKIPKVNLSDLTEIVLDRTQEMEALHLVMIGQEAKICPMEWQEFVLKTKLQVLTGTAAGITNICAWKREVKAGSTEFDVNRFKEDYPEIASEFMQSPSPTIKHQFNSYRAYPHQ